MIICGQHGPPIYWICIQEMQASAVAILQQTKFAEGLAFSMLRDQRLASRLPVRTDTATANPGSRGRDNSAEQLYQNVILVRIIDIGQTRLPVIIERGAGRQAPEIMPCRTR